MVMRCCGCDRHVDRSPTLKALLAGSKLIAPRLCSSCLARFKMITGATCPGCGRSGDARICADCRQWEQQGRLLHNRALFVYDAAMKQWIYQYKGLGDYRLHDAFQDLIAAQLQNAGTLVAIPSESKHYDVRGFDPIQGLFGGLQLQPWLRKSPTAKPQAQKNRRERLQTPQSFTVLVPAAKLNQTKQITLVDDLYTTGRTLYHARDALVAAGFQGMVTAFTLIR